MKNPLVSFAIVVAIFIAILVVQASYRSVFGMHLGQTDALQQLAVLAAVCIFAFIKGSYYIRHPDEVPPFVRRLSVKLVLFLLFSATVIALILTRGPH